MKLVEESIPKRKELFMLNYTQAMLAQFCFFTAWVYGARSIDGATARRPAVAPND